METPFLNDPFAITWIAFKNLYPDKQCKCWFYSDIFDKENEKVYGLTNFEPDGSIIVLVDSNLSAEDATEILAHELAHVAAGYDHGHDEVWESIFDEILDEYDRVGKEIVKSN